MLWGTAIINILFLSVRGPSLYFRIHRRQILTYKDVPRTERVEQKTISDVCTLYANVSYHPEIRVIRLPPAYLLVFL